MGKLGVILVSCVAFGGVMLLTLFNSCGNTNSGGLLSSSVKFSSEREASEDEVDDLLSSIPQDELDTLRPISDLEKHPELLEVFDCGDGTISICHFPNNVDQAHTLCVGVSALDSHKRHEITVDANGDLVGELSDYLGPCRH